MQWVVWRRWLVGRGDPTRHLYRESWRVCIRRWWVWKRDGWWRRRRRCDHGASGRRRWRKRGVVGRTTSQRASRQKFGVRQHEITFRPSPAFVERQQGNDLAATLNDLDQSLMGLVRRAMTESGLTTAERAAITLQSSKLDQPIRLSWMPVSNITDEVIEDTFNRASWARCPGKVWDTPSPARVHGRRVHTGSSRPPVFQELPPGVNKSAWCGAGEWSLHVHQERATVLQQGLLL